jgi:hypothetical protein
LGVRHQVVIRHFLLMPDLALLRLVLYHRLRWHMAGLRLRRFLGPILIRGLLLALIVCSDALALISHGNSPSGPNAERSEAFCPTPDKGTILFNPRFVGGCTQETAMEIVYFIGALVLLTALIYGTLRSHHQKRLKDKKTDQIVRDRYEHNRT